MTAALINHPHFGSLWLENARIEGNLVMGEAWDTGEIGSPYLPDDYMGEYVPMHFPKTCIRKWSHT